MKKIYTLFLTSLTIALTYSNSSAQCAGGRYHDYVFDSLVVTSNIQYGSNLKANNQTQNLLLDVYQPYGDTLQMRPLVIIAHGGSFVYGAKNGTDVVPLCNSLSKLGYVTASIEYRLGMTNFPLQVQHPLDSTDAGAAVMRGTHDGRAAVRFFRKNARVGGNTYAIDTNNIYFLGVSAGGFIALHLAYLDQTSELIPFIDTTGVTVGTMSGQPGLHGGVEGSSGNDGYPSSVKAIVNLCGALVDTTDMHTGDTPLLSFHGTADGTVPYDYSLITLLGAYPLLKVHGSSTVAMRANHQGITNCFETWYGAGHVPEVGTTAANQRYYDSTITITRNFLEHFTCGIPLNCGYTSPPVNLAGISETMMEYGVSLFPNPASGELTIMNYELRIKNIALYNVMGEKVYEQTTNQQQTTINIESLSKGIYFVQLTGGDKQIVYTGKIIKE